MADDSPRDRPNLPVQPPVLLGALLVLGLGLDRWVPLAVRFEPGWPWAAALLLLGVIPMAWGYIGFRGAGTRVEPWKPTTALVTDGIHRWSRNPIYIGEIVFFAGCAAVFESPWLLVLVVPFALILHFGVVLREEAFLAERFGQSYLDYKARTRRWF